MVALTVEMKADMMVGLSVVRLVEKTVQMKAVYMVEMMVS